MSKGDTTVHVDFEVGGASAAKMTVMDVYRTQQANASKVNDAARALSKEQQITFSEAKKALREWVRMQTQAANEAATAQKKAAGQSTTEEAARERARLSLAAQKSKALEAQFMETERKRKRAAEEAIRDSKRVAREEIRDAKRVAREKAREMARGGGMGAGKLLGRGLWGAAMGVAGYAGVAGVSSAISSQFNAASNSANKRSEMESAITPVVALGDNVKNMAAIRAEVVGLAAILGKSNQEIGAFLEAVDSMSNTMAAEKLADIKKETIELTSLVRGDLRDNFNVLAKTEIIFGDAFDSANQMQNKMYKVQSDTVSSMEEFSQRMPDIMAAGKALGLTVDEIAAAVVSATTVGGTAEKAYTGAKTAFIAMAKAKDKGIPLTGTLVEQLNQLSDAAKAGKIDLIDIFQGEGITSGFGIVDQLDKVTENVKAFQEIGSGTDTVGDNLKAKYENKRFAVSSLRDLDKSILENAPNISADLGIENPLTQLMARFRTGKIAGAAVSDGMWGAPTAFGIAAAMGHQGVLSAGNKIRLGYMPEGSPNRKKLINDQLRYEFGKFEAQKTKDIDALGYDHKASAALGNYFGYDGRSDEVKSIEDRAFDFNASKNNMPSLETTMGRVSIAEDLNVNQREANKILAEIRDRLAPRSSTTMKPGGGTTNNSEL